MAQKPKFTPGSFDPDTCRHYLGDERCRVIEADAREAAESFRDRWAVWRDWPTEGLIRPDTHSNMGWVKFKMEVHVWMNAFNKRKNRLDRVPDDQYFIDSKPKEQA